MRTFKQYIEINEWKYNSNSNIKKEFVYKFFPETYNELKEIIYDRYVKTPEILDLNDIYTGNITSFGDMYDGEKTGSIYRFYGLFCQFSKVEIIDIRSWNTSKLTCTTNMFLLCEKLREIRGIENFNMKNVTYMNNMFEQCKSLERLDLSKWELNNQIKSANNMFRTCTSLKELKGVEKWKNITFIKNTNMFDNIDKKLIPSWYKQ